MDPGDPRALTAQPRYPLLAPPACCTCSACLWATRPQQCGWMAGLRLPEGSQASARPSLLLTGAGHARPLSRLRLDSTLSRLRLPGFNLEPAR